jgi:hypothetical protein
MMWIVAMGNGEGFKVGSQARTPKPLRIFIQMLTTTVNGITLARFFSRLQERIHRKLYCLTDNQPSKIVP